MKEKVIGVSLFVLIIFVIFIIISSNIMINKYEKISKTIDKQITDKKMKIEIKEKDYEQLKKNNDANEKQLENINNYIDTLNEKVKEYEK